MMPINVSCVIFQNGTFLLIEARGGYKKFAVMTKTLSSNWSLFGCQRLEKTTRAHVYTMHSAAAEKA